MLLIPTIATATDTSYSQVRQPTLKELHPDQPVRPEPVVHVDRHVLNADDYKHDPSILISERRPEPTQAAIDAEHDALVKKVVALKKDLNEAVTVRTQWCDDKKCDEWR